MLTITKEHIAGGLRGNGSAGETGRVRPAINPQAEIHLFGQEVNPETWAVSKSDIYMKDPTGRDADNIAFGSTLSNDRHPSQTFDYLIANPPYGKDWKRDQETVEAEHQRGAAGRFGPGLPRISDGQILFLLHMLAHARPPDQGGARIAIIMNGSPLFTGDAGSGESEIRRFIFENDLLEALIALPEQLFYNTGIATYVWLLTNRKAPERQGKVQLIDATSFWSPMRRSLGDKRREIPPDRAVDVLTLLADYKDGDTRTRIEGNEDEDAIVSRIFPPPNSASARSPSNARCGSTSRQPPNASPAWRIRRDFRIWRSPGSAARRGPKKKPRAVPGSRPSLPCWKGRPTPFKKTGIRFSPRSRRATAEAQIKLAAPVKKAILTALAERDETAAICRGAAGEPEPDPDLRDTERVPLPEGEDPVDTEKVPASARAFFEREVKPHVPDAWIDTSKRDHKDRKVGLVGYEINFNRYFYRYKPPRPIAEIEADIQTIENDILEMLKDMRAG